MKTKTKIFLTNAVLVFIAAAILAAAACYRIRLMTVDQFPEILSKLGSMTGLFIGFAAALIVLLKFMSIRQKANLAVFILAVGGMLYFAEGMVRLLNINDPRATCRAILAEKGLLLSNEERRELVDKAMRKNPRLVRYHHRSLDWFNKEGGLLLLNNASRAIHLGDNEHGYRVINHTDEYGFRNPIGWHRRGLDAVFVGDSYVYGGAVREEDTIASKVRERGVQVLSLGKPGAGPLSELAILMEYTSPLEPKTVFWFYYEGNDLTEWGNLEREMKSGAYDGYLSGRRRGLRSLQPEIDEYILEHGGRNIRDLLPGWVSFKRLRRVLRASFRRFRNPDHIVSENTRSQFKIILSAAKSEVESWNGSFYFVYLPTWERYQFKKDDDYISRGAVFDLVKSLDIPIVDIHEVFINTPDPLALFPCRLRGHYTPEGYALVADALQEFLAAEKSDQPAVTLP